MSVTSGALQRLSLIYGRWVNFFQVEDEVPERYEQFELYEEGSLVGARINCFGVVAFKPF